MTDEIQQLTDLREQVLNTALPLVTEGNVSPTQKFTMLMSIARANGSTEALRSAYSAACQIEENDAKVDALMTLVNEIELIIEDTEDITEELSEVSDQQPN